MPTTGVNDDDVKILFLEFVNSICCYDYRIYLCVAERREWKYWTQPYLHEAILSHENALRGWGSLGVPSLPTSYFLHWKM